MDLTELNTRGWALVDGVSSQTDLLELGKALGSPVRTPNGELVKEIRRIPRDEAPPGSQSALYGAGPFPLHTDTVFWPLPVRYVLLRGYGDTRRPTTVKSFSELVRNCDTQFHVCARDSVWLVGAVPRDSIARYNSATAIRKAGGMMRTLWFLQITRPFTLTESFVLWSPTRWMNP